MSAYKDAFSVDGEPTEQRLAVAAEILAGSDGVVLLQGRLALRPGRGVIQCEVIDPVPGSHRCEEEFKVLVENACRMLAQSRLGAMLPPRPLRWSVVEDRGSGTTEAWPGRPEPSE